MNDLMRTQAKAPIVREAVPRREYAGLHIQAIHIASPQGKPMQMVVQTSPCDLETGEIDPTPGHVQRHLINVDDEIAVRGRSSKSKIETAFETLVDAIGEVIRERE